MAWYNKYLSVYEKPFAAAPGGVVTEVREKLRLIQSDKPLVTVSVIAYNEERHLLACLWSLSEMVCKYPVEIIGVNNNSNDRTEQIFQQLQLPYFNELQNSCGFARLCGLNHARGKFHINIDADTLYPSAYVETMTDALIEQGVVAAGASWSYMPDESHSRISLFFYECIRDLYLKIQSVKRPELSVRGLVFAYDTASARKVGIRTDIKRGEDGSLALGLKQYGKIVFVGSRKARAVTGYGTVGVDGGLLNSFKIRFVKGLKALPGMFRKKHHYEDEDSNLINRKG